MDSSGEEKQAGVSQKLNILLSSLLAAEDILCCMCVCKCMLPLRHMA